MDNLNEYNGEPCLADRLDWSLIGTISGFVTIVILLVLAL